MLNGIKRFWYRHKTSSLIASKIFDGRSDYVLDAIPLRYCHDKVLEYWNLNKENFRILPDVGVPHESLALVCVTKMMADNRNDIRFAHVLALVGREIEKDLEPYLNNSNVIAEELIQASIDNFNEFISSTWKFGVPEKI